MGGTTEEPGKTDVEVLALYGAPSSGAMLMNRSVNVDETPISASVPAGGFCGAACE